MRKELRCRLRRLHDETHVTSVFVTHDQEEAMEVADRIVLMNEGRIEPQRWLDEVYDRPATAFMLQCLDDVSRFHGRLGHGDAGAGVRPNTPLEFKRVHEADCVCVALPRAEYIALRDRLGLKPGSAAPAAKSGHASATRWPIRWR